MSAFEFAERATRSFESYGSLIPLSGVMPPPPPGYNEWLAARNAKWEAERPTREARAAELAAEREAEDAEHRLLVDSLVGLTITQAEWTVERSDDYDHWSCYQLTLSDGRTVEIGARGYDGAITNLEIVDEDGAK